MSDELIFDSERLARKAAKKRLLIPLLVLAAVLIAALILALILRGRKGEQHRGGEATDYPYVWTLKANGDAELTVPHEDLPEGRWDLKDGEESLPALRVTRQEKEGSDGTVFLLHPEAEGRSLFTLVLLGPGESPAKGYEMTLLAEVSRVEEQLSVSLLNASGTRLQTELSGGADSENPYRIFTNQRNELVISLPVSESEMDWEYELPQGEDSLEPLGLLYEDGLMNLYLRAGATPGPAQLVLRSQQAAAELRLSLETGADGSLKVLSHEADYGEKPRQETVPDTTFNPHQYALEETGPYETAPTGPEGDLAKEESHVYPQNSELPVDTWVEEPAP